MNYGYDSYATVNDSMSFVFSFDGWENSVVLRRSALLRATQSCYALECASKCGMTKSATFLSRAVRGGAVLATAARVAA